MEQPRGRAHLAPRQEYEVAPRRTDAHWAAFVRHTNVHYRAAFVRIFEERRVLHCVGPLDGSPCPHAFTVDLATSDARGALECLHLDHSNRPAADVMASWATRHHKCDIERAMCHVPVQLLDSRLMVMRLSVLDTSPL